MNTKKIRCNLIVNFRGIIVNFWYKSSIHRVLRVCVNLGNKVRIFYEMFCRNDDSSGNTGMR